MPIELKEVKNLRNLKKFVKFPYKHYKNNKYWIPPLISGELNTLRPEKNPSLEHCDWKYMLAYKDGKLVGRIGGIINHRFIEQWGKKYARFCWFEFIDDDEVSELLLQDIEQWALSKGMEGLLGPMGFSTFERQGMLYTGFDEISTFASTYNWEYYPKHLERHGYRKEIDYVEYEVKVPEEIPEKALKIRDLIMQRYKLTSIKAKSTKELLPYARQVFHIINEAYKPLFGFVQLTDKQIDYFVKKYFSFIDPAYVTAVVDENDRLLGFQISIPSLSKAFQKARGSLFPFGFYHLMRAMKNPNRVDIMLVAVHPEYQNKGINSIFMTDLTEICIKKGIEWAESNGELEENIKVQNFWRYFDARQHKRTRVFFKSLTRE
ncbi:MAG TPA: GNAT family N-acetyltransferase [Bacteroidales bacterium]|nr:GNAT family N-acetyltransferase [Bacteroidales bacterium]